MYVENDGVDTENGEASMDTGPTSEEIQKGKELKKEVQERNTLSECQATAVSVLC